MHPGRDTFRREGFEEDMRSFGHILMTLLLIAVMAIPAVSPPALRHSHTDGDKSHQHGAASAERL